MQIKIFLPIKFFIIFMQFNGLLLAQQQLALISLPSQFLLHNVTLEISLFHMYNV
uniref:Uncharacterized protein n=1 Tax=Rhizophora mucronata TaxID=61149 RepID=A0A2P2NPV0_RHIMU